VTAAKPFDMPVGAPFARILGVGGYRPSRVVTNEEIIEKIDSTDQWIRERSGIATRHHAGPDETVVEMATDAAEKALANAGVTADQLGCIVLATVTHLSQTPAAATLVAAKLGANAAAAFDVSAACAGFCHGLELASNMVRLGSAEYVLVIGVERLTDIIDPYDRSVAFIFGDGAGAAVVGPSTEPGIGPVVWGANGNQADAIKQDSSWDVFKDDPAHKFPSLTMHGQRVFRWAVFEMAPVAAEAMRRAGVTADELDAFIPHQANLRIVDAMARKLELPEHVAIARDVVDTGNTSAASIPLAMERMLRQGDVAHGGTALLIGFGAGLAYAAQVVTLP